MVLAFHAFTNSEDEYPEDWGEAEGYGGALDFMAMRMADGQIPVSQLISSGVCDQHPTLDFVIVECGAGWLAWLLYALDEQAEKKRMWIRPHLSMKPSEFFARQGHVTFTDDPVALKTLSFHPDPISSMHCWHQKVTAEGRYGVSKRWLHPKNQTFSDLRIPSERSRLREVRAVTIAILDCAP